ncbi:hypothetical protein O181_002256 [Austropuccinia psidii MF-1]|uniref:Uncharacterized protein n=1 Tax=Austropuccinia psidii MF-1 TaxID=1389203 RepID=A0A9Q3BBL7_9BASI|nr:hypothetical protein [Austropuccinia psidii MF-1]
MVYRDKDWEMLPQIHRGVMNSWQILKKVLKEEKIEEKRQAKKEGGKQGRSPNSFYQQATSQATSSRREEEKEKQLKETIFPKLQDPKNPKGCHGQCFKNGQNLDGNQGQRGTKNETTPFTKEITFSPEVVNT